MGAGASTGEGEIVTGDVVTIHLPDYERRVIGIVSEIHDDQCTVQVSQTELIKNIQRADIKRIAFWNEIEVGDSVKVKEEGSRLYHEANVLCRNEDGTFKVKFDEDEIEDGVSLDRIMKLMSGRLEQKEWMMYKEE